MKLPKLELDMDGYPTEKTLKAIKTCEVKTGTDALKLLLHIKKIWHLADWGWTEKKAKSKSERIFYISTGGWSGNEDIINALRDNHIFWMLSWYSIRRGGHFEFKILIP